MEANCIKCNKVLLPDEIGATKKFVNRGATEFLCLDCLAQRFKVSRSLLEEKIEFLRENGCSLFPK